MYKKGFTLAEVLITLTMIGTVAALVIPSLAVNIQTAEYKTAWKKSFATIIQATQMIRNDNGGTLIGAFSDAYDTANKYSKYLNVEKI